MAENNHDSFASYLLCLETMSLCFDDHDSPVTDEHSHQSNGDISLIFGNERPKPFVGLPLSEESFGMMVERESQHSPNDDYLKKLKNAYCLHLSVRIEALDWIWKVHSDFGFGVLSFCLSITYLDRFLSVYELTRSKTWTEKLLALACLSLAIKMEETNNSHSTVAFQGELKVWFDGETIRKMEILVMSTLNWRMYSCTPCTFIDYFLRKINGDYQITSWPLISRSMQLISSTMKGIEFLEFKPSEVATAVALFVSKEMQLITDLDQAISSCFTHQILKERVMECVKLIQDLAASLDGGSAASLAGPTSPNVVFEADKIDEISVPSHTKRRRVDVTNSAEKTRE